MYCLVVLMTVMTVITAMSLVGKLNYKQIISFEIIRQFATVKSFYMKGILNFARLEGCIPKFHKG